MDRQQFPTMGEPGMATRATEIRAAERSQGHESRHRQEADA